MKTDRDERERDWTGDEGDERRREDGRCIVLCIRVK